jgi:SAM-dependent methyltransferase
MRQTFVDDLVDPVSGASLHLVADRMQGDDVVEGWLVGPDRSYPIVRGVPRFAGFDGGNDYVRSFGYQWARWASVQFESENAGRPMAGYTARMWERITGIRDTDLKGALIGDFGCGPGRFTDVVRRRGGRVIALDLSAAVESAAARFQNDPDVLICQADILAPPLRPECLDGAFTIGVLHHTPAPARGLAALARTVRRGGWIASTVYPKGGHYDRRSVKVWRALFSSLWPVAGPRAPLVYAHVTAHLGRWAGRVPGARRLFGALLPFVALPDMRWAVLDTFDSVTPRYQSAHTSDEVRGWFRDAGLTDIQPADWGPTSYRAVRK